VDAELSLAPRPELVRTARLVAGAAARRAGVDDELIDDVRLAVGVAAARAVLRQGAEAHEGPVRLSFAHEDDQFVVRVRDTAGPPAAPDDDPLDLAMVEALAPRSSVSAAGGGSEVLLAWPVAAP
jgi:anti-sigma regulatory factor (Ser/Thr protein kinase)